WMCFAIVTGILYGRFSKPSALLVYSEKAIISPYKEGLNSLQFRIANKRMSNLMELQATVILMQVKRDKTGKSVLKRSFLKLDLERDSILFFPLNWTIAHPIDKNSPLYGKTRKELMESDAEILIMIRGFDDTFSNVVHSRHSYKYDEIIWGAKFQPTYETQDDGDIELYFDRLSDYEKTELNN
ncbi:MAG: potassium transporter, partial [Fulvivirga sp.]|nr:potassium transporter [Fulvivirga sp.]